jgi:uncharacterized protein YyaL (SSP411 family)
MESKKITLWEREAINWLFRAQDANRGGGISKYFDLKKGWCQEDYKEVSGYIIPTLIELYHKTKNKEYRERAIRIADWELQVQGKEGEWDYVFDTGQVILGLVSIYKETKNKKYLIACIKASKWLLKSQDKNGSWTKHEFALGIKNKILRKLKRLPHAYNSRTAWALLEIWLLTKDERYKNAAISNLDWTKNQQKPNGYYNHCHSYIHYLTYCASGLFEAGIILNEEKYIRSAKKYIDSSLRLSFGQRYIEGNYNSRWKRIKKSHSSLTSDCQLAILYFKFYELYKIKKYKEEGNKLLGFVKEQQDLISRIPGKRGGIPGSYPINGFYCPNKILSWATKFYLDALIISKEKKISLKP